MTTIATGGWVPVADAVVADLGWSGPLLEALATPGVTDVVVQSPGEAWIDRGLGMERVAVDLLGADAVRELAVRLAALGGRRLDDAAPIVDARLPDGSRLHAVLPPVAFACAAISIRVVSPAPFALEDLVASGMVPEAAAPMLRGLVRTRASFVVSGPTGAGKTTLLATLLGLVDPAERVVLIEESGEVATRHPHVVRLVERAANVEGAGGVPLGALVRASVRMRPDRIVLGEARGAEVREVMTAFNTGHRGGMCTLHANSAGDVMSRLVALGALAGMSRDAVAMHAGAAFDAVLHLQRSEGGRRLVALGAVTPEGVRVVASASEDGWRATDLRAAAWAEAGAE